MGTRLDLGMFIVSSAERCDTEPRHRALPLVSGGAAENCRRGSRDKRQRMRFLNIQANFRGAVALRGSPTAYGRVFPHFGIHRAAGSRAKTFSYARGFGCRSSRVSWRRPNQEPMRNVTVCLLATLSAASLLGGCAAA